MSTTTPEPILLNPDQANRILTYAIENRMYETGAEGLAGVPEQQRLNDAATLAFQAKRAYDAGNQRAEVMEVLFIAEVAQRDGTPMAPVAPAAAAPAAAPVATDPYATSTEEQLEQALAVFRNSPPSDAITAEIQRIEATLNQRRGANAQAAPAPQPAQEVAPLPASAAPPAAPAPVPQPPAPAPAAATPAAAAPSPVGGGQPTPMPVAPAAAPAAHPHVPTQYSDLPPVPGRPNPGVITAGGDTAAADAAHQLELEAAQPSPQGPPAPAQAPSQDGGRQALLSRLTYEILQAYGQTLDSVANLTDDQIRLMLSNPGNVQQPTSPMPDVQPGGSAVSPQREALEAQVTGATLKAWKRGRKNIPELSDEELAFMLANPTGPPAEQPAQAQQPAASPAPVAEQSVPAPLAAEAQPQPTAAPPAQEQALPPAPAQPSIPVPRAPSVPSAVGTAAEIIAREHLPIPPDIEEEYRLPNDVSKVSDVELHSIHARAHAVEARCNWIISEMEDGEADIEKLIRNQIRLATDQLPETEEGKKLTKVRKEELIESDEELVRLREELKDRKREIGKIKVIRDNAHRDCERLSRQWSYRSGEERLAPSR